LKGDRILNKYRLEVTQEQLSVINEALEEYFRIRMGQFWDLADNLAVQNVDLSPENPEHEKIFDLFINTRDCIREILETVNRILGLQLRKKTDRMLVAEDIWQVIRHQMWKDRGNKDNWCVDSREPVQWGNEPLPKIENVSIQKAGMTEVLVSIKQKWWDKIRAGEKTIECRMSKPKDIPYPFKIIWYVTGGVGIVGESICDGIWEAKNSSEYDRLVDGSCLTRFDLMEYGCGRPVYGWRIASTKEYDEIIPLDGRPPQSWKYWRK
jgi:predicted transcriptional regulator